MGRSPASPPKCDLYQRFSVRLSSRTTPDEGGMRGKQSLGPERKRFLCEKANTLSDNSSFFAMLLCGCLLLSSGKDCCGKNLIKRLNGRKGELKGLIEADSKEVVVCVSLIRS